MHTIVSRMTLDDYRKKRGWSYTELARQVGASQATVARRWCLEFGHKQRLIPNQKYMDIIMRLSMGEVMPNDFYIQRD